MSKITLKELAALSGVSVNTVSRALRDMPDIGEDTKRRIEKLACETGYRKNMAASLLRAKHSAILGVIVTDIGNPVFSGMVKGIESAAKNAGYTVMLINSNESADIENSAVTRLAAYGADGIIITPSMESTAVLDTLDGSGIPYILLARRFSPSSAGYVVNDDRCGGMLAAEHLYSLGHREFMYIAPPMNISSSRERFEGFSSYLARQGLDLSRVLRMTECRPSKDDARVCFERVASEGRVATGIFCFSDYMALGVYAAARKLGIRIPDDISVVGCDDIELSDAITPPLTTVCISGFRLGELAAGALIKRISGDEPDRTEVRTVLKPTLTIRESTRRRTP